MMGHRRAGFNAAGPRLGGRQPRVLGMLVTGRGVSSNRSKSSSREAPQPQIDSVHGHYAAFPKDIYHLVPGAWGRNQLDNISSRNPNSYTLPVQVANRERRLFQFESPGMHGSTPMQTI